jgi:hypothetical protein
MYSMRTYSKLIAYRGILSMRIITEVGGPPGEGLSMLARVFIPYVGGQIMGNGNYRTDLARQSLGISQVDSTLQEYGASTIMKAS